MTAPTQTQVRVLKALHHRSASVAGSLTQTEPFDGLAPREWLVVYADGAGW
ncbi:hypothetical protein ACFWFQ_25890 [Nocardia salmonicida]|uniref:hypothetical protein n=1 Tax=Nocardia salmonicida TaxID=53431 RepID=UPI00366292FD